jgi:hypothetical protein
MGEGRRGKISFLIRADLVGIKIAKVLERKKRFLITRLERDVNA